MDILRRYVPKLEMTPTRACSWRQSGVNLENDDALSTFSRTNNHGISADTPSSYLRPNSHQIDPIGYDLGDINLAICNNKLLRMQDLTFGITWNHHHAAPH